VDATRVACLIGSTMGGSISLHQTFRSLIPEWNTGELSSTMSSSACPTLLPSTCAVLGLLGMVVAPSAACSSALQAIEPVST